jgi:hypothetical protein
MASDFSVVLQFGVDPRTPSKRAIVF